MCSYFLHTKMDNYQGDLGDIIRASGGSGGGGRIGVTTTTTTTTPSDELPDISTINTDSWQFQSDYPQIDLSEDFGHPFSNFRDPLLHELDIPGPSFFSSSSGLTNMSTMKPLPPIVDDRKIRLGDDQIKITPTNNIFSRMLQISSNPNFPVSPCDSPLLGSSPSRGIKSTILSSSDMINTNTSKNCLLENSALQISSPRNTGIKRRKSQSKKVVCIPAPAPANSRPTGEIVPSDLWAWRKYGQKPIKGSPYPRGYYRCSSSKGCSARKQVERSRTDPNMLVITYTSEHNHPWPTQRNALAGSTRTQSSKSGPSSSNSKSSYIKGANVKEEEKECTTNENIVDNNTDKAKSDIASPSMVTTSSGTPLKEEVDEKEMEMDDINVQFNEEFPHSYRPMLPDSNHSDDFFADLGEIEADPLNLLFDRENKGLDAFSFYDWTGNNNNNNNNITHFGESKRGL